MTTSTPQQNPAPTDTRGVMPHTVIWVELPQTGSDRTDRDHMPAYDPAALCEECERWDGMA